MNDGSDIDQNPTESRGFSAIDAKLEGIEDLIELACAQGGLPTDDVLKAFVPLAKQVLQSHVDGFVAPLEGLANLKLDHGRIFYLAADQQANRRQDFAISRAESRTETTIEVTDSVRDQTFTVESRLESTQVAKSDESIEGPVYMNGYVCWEHLLEHHDPLSDVFCLGQILASLSCGIDFRDHDEVQKFASARNNLFAIHSTLNPIVAQTIYRTTQLRRHDRAQDLNAIIQTLETYRDGSADIGFELQWARQADKKAGRNELILRKLRERLFDLSRRNRLLHFSPTMATINLTQASVPLTLDPATVDLNKLLIANDSLVQSLGKGKQVSLTDYIDFQEVLYAPSSLNRIITEERLDRAEYGFAGLRLATAFLNWANVKVKPVELYSSPLILVGITLKKKKGVRDKYLIQATDADAEVNPALRHLMNQLYEIELPETVPLKAGAIEELARWLQAKIAESDASIELDLIERPQIELIQKRAEKRLQSYKRRARVSGRGVRHFGDLQYSYDPANYHPLGVRIFEHHIRPAETDLDALTRSRVPPRRQQMVDTGDSESKNPSESASTTTKTFYRWKEGGTGNPYRWQIDLCNITLASFRYRKMSLVRDYDAMIRDSIENPAFKALFSETPSHPPKQEPKDNPIEHRFDVVPCDPTQAAAIAEARDGKHYIIQGPPGTGKSQTITNLIADFVGRGKRVLFVCEKRAAIDVVYARLKAIGLAPISCLIHDAQADKKEFIADLKQTYESFLDPMSDAHDREKLHRDFRQELGVLQRVQELSDKPNEAAGMPLRDLVERCIGLQGDRENTLSPHQRERLPTYSEWTQSRAELAAMQEKLKPIQADGTLANHPLAKLRSDIVHQPQPLAHVESQLEVAKRSLSAIERRMKDSTIESRAWASVTLLEEIIGYAETAAPLAAANLMDVVEIGHQKASEINRRVEKLQRLSDKAMRAASKNNHWIDKLSQQDTESALTIAQNLSGKLTNLVNPSWWRLRSVMNKSYNFKAHSVRPTWVALLENLRDEHDCNHAVDELSNELRSEYGIDEDPLNWPARINRLSRMFTHSDTLRSQIHRPVMRTLDPAKTLCDLSDCRPSLEHLCAALDKSIDDWRDESIQDVSNRIDAIEQAMGDLPRFLSVMESVSKLPQRVGWAIKTLALPIDHIEYLVADTTYHSELHRHPAYESFHGGARSAHAIRLADLYSELLQANAHTVLQSVAKRFRRHVAASEDSTPTTREDRNDRRSYQKARRELEHEFGKQMRYKPIRKLLSSDTRRVIIDLKPVWLMSPLSVSDTLPLSADVDVVIFDEASQVTLEQAVPAFCRGKQVVVVGDQMQLPPTNFFSRTMGESDDEVVAQDSEGEEISYDLSASSFLSFADRSLPSSMLGWHYRSRSESLISFSNWRFYNGSLLTIPEENFHLAVHLEDEDTNDSQAMNSLHQSAVSFHFMGSGIYENRRNRVEAEQIAEQVRHILCDPFPDISRLPPKPTVGVIAFSQAQQSEIESALARLAESDEQFAHRLEEEAVREENGQFVGLLVKNLENIQGDERDVILLSVCYGPDQQGRMRMNFGPINKSGGEKRLNVAFSRAKHHMSIISSIRHSAITNDYNTGAATLRDYLRYADAISGGRSQEAADILRRLQSTSVRTESEYDETPSPLKQKLSEALKQRGWVVNHDVGQSRFRIDLAISKPGDSRYRLGILLDDTTYRRSDLFERDVQRPMLLEAFGWSVTMLLAKDWYTNPAAELERIEKLCRADS